MSLDKLVDAAYKAALPFRVLDKGVKLAYDAAAAAAGKTFGIDRFELAKFTTYTSAACFGAAAAVNAIIGNHFYFATYAAIAPVYAFISPKNSDSAREYFTKPKEVLSRTVETGLLLYRLLRLPTLIVAGITLRNGVIETPNNYGEILAGVGVLSLTSYMFLIDGDHATWDKVKKLARNAYESVAGLAARGAPQRALQPAPTSAVSAQGYSGSGG